MDFINMVVRVLEPVPAVIGLKARYTHDRSNTKRQTIIHTRIHIHGSSESPAY